MSSKKPKETKTAFTNEQRKAIIKHKEKNPQISQADLNKDEIGENPLAKRQKTVQYLVLKNSLYEWILQYQERVILYNEII
ncbi:6786_t:CDS:2, partial [Cetraspora pellucida]